MDEQFTFSGSFYVIFQNLAFQILPSYAFISPDGKVICTLMSVTVLALFSHLIVTGTCAPDSNGLIKNNKANLIVSSSFLNIFLVFFV